MAATRVFLSYARGDDEAFGHRLHADLTKAGFDVWFDRVSLPSRQLTFHQEIKDAIRERDRLVCVAGPRAAVSDYVREEWRFALEADKSVIPILRKGNITDVPGELCLLHTEDFRDDAQYEAQLAKLIANLNRPEPPLGRLYAVPNLPAHFLGRPEFLRRLKDAVLVDLQKPVVVTSATSRVGLQGMGGIGKSVLAAAAARDREIRRSYPDGVIWVSFGQDLDDLRLAQLMRDVARHLGDEGAFESVAQGQGALRTLLIDKAVLLVLDDVCRAKDAQAFDVLGPRCRALVTTRDAGILQTLHGKLYPVELFTETEALALLAAAVGLTPDRLPPEAREIVRECGCLPLAVALCGGMAKKDNSRWENILRRLREAALEKIADREAINEQHRSIYRAMQVSVEALEAEQQRRFAELSVFVTDQTVPEAAVTTLWGKTGGLDDLDTEDLLVELSERSLIRLDKGESVKDGRPGRRISLHDLLYDYAARISGDRRELQNSLIEAYRAKCPAGWPSGQDDGYFFQNLANHLTAVEDWQQAAALVTDFPWLMRKCALGLLDSVMSDFDSLLREAGAGRGPESHILSELKIWQVFFRERAHIFRYGNTERLAHKILLQLAVEHADDSPLAIAAESWLAEDRCDWLWLRRVPRLPHVHRNPCLVVLEGHTDFVWGALLLADGGLVSWSTDKTVRIWNMQTGKCLAVLEGHADDVWGALLLADGRLVSWSKDRTLRVWDAATGLCVAVLAGHADEVGGALALASGRLVSWSKDGTLRVWDAATGACLAVLAGHADEVGGALALASGRLVSWSKDGTLRIWDAAMAECLAVLAGHAEEVRGALELANGRLVSWSKDGTLRVWDAATGACLAMLEGHTGGVARALELASGRLVSWSEDHTLRVWNVQTGDCLHVLEKFLFDALELANGRLVLWAPFEAQVWNVETAELLSELKNIPDAVVGTVELTDGRLVSWFSSLLWDPTLWVWNAETGKLLAVLAGHTGRVWGALPLADGRLVSWSDDHTLRVWNAQETGLRAAREAHRHPVDGALALADRRLVSWSWEHSLQVWSVETGERLAALAGHGKEIKGALALANGWLVSWSGDHTLWVWNVQAGGSLTELLGHAGTVQGALELADGRLLSWSDDMTLLVWNVHTGESLAELLGHTGTVRGALELADGRLLSWSDDMMLLVWNVWTGELLAVLEGHTDGIKGALALADARLVSWSGDSTLRVWDIETGESLAVLAGHTDEVRGALALADGRVISWSRDNMLRVWDVETGESLAVFEGHIDEVRGALEFAGGRLVSWSDDRTLRLWDIHGGACLEAVSEVDARHRHPEWLHARATVHAPASVVDGFWAQSPFRTAQLCHRNYTDLLASWNADSDSTARCLLPDGTVVVTQVNGQVCILKLHHGNRRITLADADSLLRRLLSDRGSDGGNAAQRLM
jgi:WD40 repeat protein